LGFVITSSIEDRIASGASFEGCPRDIAEAVQEQGHAARAPYVNKIAVVFVQSSHLPASGADAYSDVITD
jgi:hypothetical protein